MWFVLCCVVSRRCASPFPSRRRVAVPFGLYFGPPPLFIPGVPSLACVCIAPRGIWRAPAIAPSRDLATPHPFVSYVVWLLAQSDMPVRWEDVHISSIGLLVLNLVPHTPFLYSYLLMLFSRDYGGRETMFENSKDPIRALPEALQEHH